MICQRHAAPGLLAISIKLSEVDSMSEIPQTQCTLALHLHDIVERRQHLRSPSNSITLRTWCCNVLEVVVEMWGAISTTLSSLRFLPTYQSLAYNNPTTPYLQSKSAKREYLALT
jgi:hypothetical protein